MTRAEGILKMNWSPSPSLAAPSSLGLPLALPSPHSLPAPASTSHRRLLPSPHLLTFSPLSLLRRLHRSTLRCRLSHLLCSAPLCCPRSCMGEWSAAVGLCFTVVLAIPCLSLALLALFTLLKPTRPTAAMSAPTAASHPSPTPSSDSPGLKTSAFNQMEEGLSQPPSLEKEEQKEWKGEPRTSVSGGKAGDNSSGATTPTEYEVIAPQRHPLSSCEAPGHLFPLVLSSFPSSSPLPHPVCGCAVSCLSLSSQG